MSRKTIFALTAVAALGVVALAPNSALARGFGGGGHASFGHSSFGHSSFQRSFSRGPSFRNFDHAAAFRHDRGHDHFAHDRFRHDWWRHYHRPYWVAPVAGDADADADAAAAQPVAAAPMAKDNCNCLTKTYLPDGSVMFKDLCTSEAAVATPDELKAQAAGESPQEK